MALLLAPSRHLVRVRVHTSDGVAVMPIRGAVALFAAPMGTHTVGAMEGVIPGECVGKYKMLGFGTNPIGHENGGVLIE